MGEKVIPKRPKGSSRHGSWDLLGNGAEWEGYNPAEASVENLRYAEGDVGTNKVGLHARLHRHKFVCRNGRIDRYQASRLYYWLLNRGIIVRWAMYIIPVLGLLWIPGIIGLAVDDTATVWQVKLVGRAGLSLWSHQLTQDYRSGGLSGCRSSGVVSGQLQRCS